MESLQVELNIQLEGTKMLQGQLLASGEIIAKKDPEIKALTDKHEKKHAEMMVLQSAYSSLQKRCEEQQTLIEVHVQQALVLNNDVAETQRLFVSVWNRRHQAESRCKDLKCLADEHIRLQKADGKSCEYAVFLAWTVPIEEADKVVVSDTADYIKRTSGDNAKCLAFLVKVAPRDKRLLTVLLDLMLEAEEKINITADVLRQHSRIMHDRGERASGEERTD